MKNSFAYYFLIIYIAAICKPALPIIQDAFAHSFWHAHHIATVHQYNGAGHVHDEVKKHTTKDDNKGTSTTKPGQPVSVHIVPENTGLTLSFGSITYSSVLFNNCQIPSLDICSPPPEVALVKHFPISV